MAQILIIEDNVEFRDVLREMLKREGYEVAVASDGEKGLNMFRNNPESLVVTDILMPHKDGIDVISELEKEFPESKVIAISGGAIASAKDCLEATKMFSCVKYAFTKPFANEELLQAVKQLVGQMQK